MFGDGRFRMREKVDSNVGPKMKETCRENKTDNRDEYFVLMKIYRETKIARHYPTRRMAGLSLPKGQR